MTPPSISIWDIHVKKDIQSVKKNDTHFCVFIIIMRENFSMSHLYVTYMLHMSQRSVCDDFFPLSSLAQSTKYYKCVHKIWKENTMWHAKKALLLRKKSSVQF